MKTKINLNNPKYKTLMKKHLVLAAAAVAFGAFAASAQASVVKDAERAQKEGKAPAEVVAIITPAFSDPETATQSTTYFIPGKAYFGEFDNLFGLKQFNKAPEDADIKMAKDLLSGYEYYMKALPLDEVTDAKGKVKTKHTKDIVNTISGHATDFYNGALAFWNAKDYNGAYDAFGIYASLYETEPFASKLKAPADTIIGEIYFNQALAAWQVDSLQNALKAFDNAERKGYNKKQLYDYAVAVANSLSDREAVFSWAKKGHELYGAEDPNYLGNMINTYLQAKEFDKAFAAIDEAIASDPNNSQYYFVKGILYDNQDKKADAKAMFKKAIELNPENVGALTQYGAALCQEAYAVSDAAPTTLTAAESAKYFDEKIRPLFVEAADYLEKAWSLDNNNMEALRYLDNVYYNLRDEAKQNDVQQRMLQ